jgi:integrase
LEIRDNPKVVEWLDECRKPSTRRVYGNSIVKFFKWYSGSFSNFLNLDLKATRHVLLKYQNEHGSEPHNTVNNVITAMCSFLMYLDKPINLRGKRLVSTPDLNSHVFTNGDLAKMFDIGNTKEKALLSLGASLGWEISAVLNFDVKTLRSLIDRAKAEDKQFIFFRSQREKTGVPRFGVLNPLALEWVEKWLLELSSRKPRKRKATDRPLSEVFDMTAEGVNLILRRLAKQAGLSLTGRVHFHRLRGWLMGGLLRAGFNEFETKYLLGKAIPLQDVTYLQRLEQDVEAKYPKAYPSICIKPEKTVQVVDQDMKAENVKLKDDMDFLKTKVDFLTGVIDELKKNWLKDQLDKADVKPKKT